MHILTNSTPIRFLDTVLKPGEWLLQDDHAFYLAAKAERGTVRINASETRGTGHWHFFKAEHTVKSILLVRSGRIGDLLLLSPCIAPLRSRFPNAQITLCALENHHPALWDEWSTYHFLDDYPKNALDADKYDMVISLENIIELATDKGIHATDAFADALGVTVTDYKPVYRVTDAEKKNALNTFPKDLIKPRPRVAIHLRSSSAIRDYPMNQWFAVLETLVVRGWEIMLIGNNDRVMKPPRQVHDCSQLSFRESAAVLSTCDVFCGVDSSFFNLCPALGVPAIGLFGPVDWKTRIKEGSGQRALKGEGCVPCGWTNTRSGERFPPGGPCNKEGKCVLLSSIEPARIVAKIERAYDESKN